MVGRVGEGSPLSSSSNTEGIWALFHQKRERWVRCGVGCAIEMWEAFRHQLGPSCRG